MMMLPYLDSADVAALTRTCKGFAQLQPLLQATAYNASRFLGQYFSDPLAFRSIQGKCGALVSGRGVRTFLQRSAHFSSYLQIFVAASQSGPMLEFLKKDGYVVVKERPISYVRTSKVVSGNKRVLLDVFVRETAAIAQALMFHPFTACLNLLSWNKVYALFPYSTFVKSECYLLRDLDTVKYSHLVSIVSDVLKVKSVAWTHREAPEGLSPKHNFVEALRDQDTDEFKELVRIRRIGDRHTWVVKLDTKGLSVPDIPTSVLESATFQLRGPHHHGQLSNVAYYVMDCDCIINHPVLKHQYVTLSLGTQDDDSDERKARHSYYIRKCQDLNTRLNELTLIELRGMCTNDRPHHQYSALKRDISEAATLRGKIDRPASWAFFDDDVIAYLDKAWQGQQKIDEQERAARNAQVAISTVGHNSAMQLLQSLLKTVSKDPSK